MLPTPLDIIEHTGYIISMTMVVEKKNRVVTDTMEAFMVNSLYLPSGTIVLSEDLDRNVTLVADVSVDNDVKQSDGGYIYAVGKSRYYVCSGFEAAAPVDATYGWRHRDGLVTLVG